MKKIIAAMLVNAMLIGVISGCSSSQDTSTIEIVKDTTTSTSTATTPTVSTASTADLDIIQLDYDNIFSTKDYEVGYISDTVINISLADNASSCDDSSVSIDGNIITVSSEGTYVFTGSLSDGQIVVDSDDTAKIQIVLDGVTISNSSSAAICVLEADKVFVTTSQDSTLTSTIIEDETAETNIDAVIFSKADLTLNGDAPLIIVSSNGNGITSKDDLVITSGDYTLTTDGHGLDANNSIRIANGSFDITSIKDGMHCEHDEDAELGYIYIANGNFVINAQGDGIDSSSQIEIADGNFNIFVAEGSANAPETTSSFGQGGGMMSPRMDTTTDINTSQMQMSSRNDISSMAIQTAGGGGGMQGGMQGGMGTTMPGMTEGTMPTDMAQGTMGEMPTDMAQGTMGEMPTDMGTMPGMTDGTQMQDRTEMTMPEDMEIPEMTEGTMPEMTDRFNNQASMMDTLEDEDDSISTKAIKADLNIVITGGDFIIDSYDDAIHSNVSTYITDGNFTIQAGDDAITSSYITSISGGSITITTCYEGLEGQKVEVSGGVITIKANDDGFNAVKNDVGIEDTETYISISGGVINMDVDNEGDGVDSNGDIRMTGGEVYIWGTVNTTDTPLDYSGSSYITGGTFVSVGSSSQTAQNFGEDSTQGSIWVQLSSTQNDDITLTDSNGNVIVEFSTEKLYQAITISTPEIVQGETYILTAGDYTETIVMESLIYGEGNEHSMGGMSGGMSQGRR
ncbi:MAG: carbohydrate-binding domain-containing protein [Clostridia bacterium]